jgi:SAM-dependent methyltransferase
VITRLLGVKGVHYVVSRFGPARLRGIAFSEKYLNGDWNFDRDQNGELRDIVSTYLRQGDLLLLGCGAASVLDGLESRGLASALGVDLSVEAIRRARRFASAKVTFQVADMEKFQPPRCFDAILFSESLYYVAAWKQVTVLEKLAAGLKPGGVFVVTLADARRYEDIIERIRSHFHMIEDRPFKGSNRQLLVFRPR